MREHFHGLLVGEKVLQMISDEAANPSGWIVDFLKPFAQARHNRGKRVFLDQVEQLFFGFEIIVQAGQ